MVAEPGKSVSVIGVENEKAYKENKSAIREKPTRCARKFLESLIREEAALRTLSRYVSNKALPRPAAKPGRLFRRTLERG